MTEDLWPPRVVSILSVAWRNGTIAPPPDMDTLDGRTLWSCTVLDRSFERQIKAEHCPSYPLGSGWCFCWTSKGPPPKVWAPERKAKFRRANLRRRLEKKFPLFADLFEADEIERRPNYFNPDAIAAGTDMRRLHEPGCLGHNGGPALGI